MTEDQIKAIAQQLRKPEGEWAKEVAERMNVGNKQMNLRSIAQLDAHGDDRVLEIGMGNGYFLKDILRISRGIHYTGCDYSAEMVSQAAVLNKAFIAQGRAEFNVSDASELPLADHSIDKILTINTIYFWPDLHKVFAEFKRVLRPGGTLILSIRPKESLLKYPISKYGFAMYEQEEVIALLQKHGFEIHSVFDKEEAPTEFLDQKTEDTYTIFEARLDSAQGVKRVFDEHEINSLLTRFEERKLPKNEWTHEAHLVIAILYVSRYEDEKALNEAREKISRYNESLGNKNTDTDGYHETISKFWLILARQFCEQNPSLKLCQLVNSFIASKLTHSSLPMQYYSKALLFSAKARRKWVSSDLKEISLTF